MIAIYLFGALLVVLLVGVTLAPLLEQEPSDVPIGDLPAGERREVALEALRELEFEHETGKLGDDEYRRQRARYGRLALDALEELETAATGETGATGAPGLRCPSCAAVARGGSRFCAQCGSPLEAGAAGSS